jgi:hypothetical protein
MTKPTRRARPYQANLFHLRMDGPLWGQIPTRAQQEAKRLLTQMFTEVLRQRSVRRKEKRCD